MDTAIIFSDQNKVEKMTEYSTFIYFVLATDDGDCVNINYFETRYFKADPSLPFPLAVVGMCGHGSATLLERKTHTARTPPTPSRQDIYEAAEDLWAKALALNTLAPEFQFQNNTEVAAQVGGEATFSCYTYHLSDEMVSTYITSFEGKIIIITFYFYI